MSALVGHIICSPFDQHYGISNRMMIERLCNCLVTIFVQTIVYSQLPPAIFATFRIQSTPTVKVEHGSFKGNNSSMSAPACTLFCYGEFIRFEAFSREIFRYVVVVDGRRSLHVTPAAHDLKLRICDLPRKTMANHNDDAKSTTITTMIHDNIGNNNTSGISSHDGEVNDDIKNKCR